MSNLSDLRFADVEALLAVCRLESITGAARELKVTPSQVSKAITRLEEQLQVQLLVRTSRGVSVSDEGERVVPLLEQIIAKLRTVGGAASRDEPSLTIVGTSYLNYLFVPRIALALPELRLRTLELPPALIRARAAENFFDLTITTSAERLPSLWRSEAVGEIRKGLFANPKFATRLGRKVDESALRELPFISPLYNVDGHFVSVDDSCPLPYNERRTGHETQTILLALELAATSDQLVFGPAIAARRYLDAGLLVEISVRDWSASEPLYVACNGDRVLRRVQKMIISTLKTALAELQS